VASKSPELEATRSTTPTRPYSRTLGGKNEEYALVKFVGYDWNAVSTLSWDEIEHCATDAVPAAPED
jgi:hypothetical protein